MVRTSWGSVSGTLHENQIQFIADRGDEDVLEDGSLSASALNTRLDGLRHCWRQHKFLNDVFEMLKRQRTLGDVAVHCVDDDGDFGCRHFDLLCGCCWWEYWRFCSGSGCSR